MKTKLTAMLMAALVMLSGCGTTQGTGNGWSNKAKGAAIGGGGGAALGAIIGAIAGKGKGAAIGAGIGAVVGGGAGLLIGNKMDKAKKAAELANAQAEVIQDQQTGLTYVKVTFDSGLLFQTGSAQLSPQAQNDLRTFAQNLTSDMNLQVYGYTDNAGWKNSTAEQSTAKNQQLSEQRANSVYTQLVGCGLNRAQIIEVKGYGETNPVADNSTAAGKAQNRRVEVYVIPSETMIQNAKQQAGE